MSVASETISATHGPRRKFWPRPQNIMKLGSFSQAMGLGRTDPKFTRFTSGVRTLVSEHLDVLQLFQDQDPERWTAFSNEVVSQFPFIKTEYEDAWPIDGYTRRWLKRMRWKHKQAMKNANQDQQGGPNEDGDAGTIRKSGRLRRSRGMPRFGPISLPIGKVLSPAESSSSSTASDSESTYRDTPSVGPSVSVRTVHAIQTARSGKAPAMTRHQTTASAGTAPSKPHDGVIRAFLQSLNPDLEDLTHKFIGAGIVNKTCLIALAGMPDWEKDKLLRDDLSLTAFQSRVVRVGLADLL
ncbi:uncharacterized protein B0H18DRAFT_1004291 [Fomitopsis serialis]|uniref:uncharacterized protein n=1 Tax=Fomitopsis serialis TaxID=139415 RepID=UPI002008C4CE|nr:uncharacterized protein B0H18DRAFT_1004291 [Neoantrodia serialis]KAH9926872.1 hypothetical protein B0H18DRAFT_1004291 [Neoantrodia serialis]